jgi:hypothetical protein
MTQQSAAAALTGFSNGYVETTCGRAYELVTGIVAWSVPALADLIRTSSGGGSEQMYILILCYIGWGMGRGVFNVRRTDRCSLPSSRTG